MQPLRDILRSSLRSSLGALTPLDRLATTWPVAAGHAIAERSTIVRLEGDRAFAEVRDPGWVAELRANTPQLAADLAKVSGVPVTDILFFAAGRADSPAPALAHGPKERHGSNTGPGSELKPGARPERRAPGRRAPG